MYPCLFHHKTEVFKKFMLFKAMATKECGEPIMKLRTDNCGEYTSKDFQAYLASKGIEHQLTVQWTPTEREREGANLQQAKPV